MSEPRSAPSAAGPVPALHLRLPAALALLALLGVLLWAQQQAVVPGGNRLAWTLQNALHAPFFMVVTLLVLLLTRGLGSRRQRWLWRAVLLLGLAFGTEAVQALDPLRQASLTDVLVNLGGAGTTILLWLAWRQPGRRLLPALAATGLLAWSLHPLLETGAAFLARDAMAPRLMDWSSRLGRHFIDLHGAAVTLEPAPADWPADDVQVARVTFTGGQWPRVTLEEVLPDWTPWQRLCVPVRVLGDTPFVLNLRLHDAHHNNLYADRVNLHPRLAPGDRVLDLHLERLRLGPRARPLDMTALDTLVIYGERDTAGQRFLLGAPFLTKRADCGAADA